MRLILSILLFLSLSASATKITLTPGGDGGNIYQCNNPAGGFYLNLAGVDTLVVSKLFTKYLFMESPRGMPGHVIVMISDPTGQVVMENGIDLHNAQYLKVTGSTTAGKTYGFRITNPGSDVNGVAVSIQGRCKNVTVEWVQVYRKTYGAWIKTDPACAENGGADSLNYPTYHMDSILLQDCDFKNIGQDCIYAGNTDPTGNRFYFCAIGTRQWIPMRLSNIRLLRLTIDSVNRTGVQLSGTDSVTAGGYNEIAYCTITRCGYEYNTQQGVGAALGGMTAFTRVHHNTISKTFLPGLSSYGVGVNRFDHNSIDSTGFLTIDTLEEKRRDPTFTMDSIVTRARRQNLAVSGTDVGTLLYSGNLLYNSYALPICLNVDTRPTFGPLGSVNNQGIALDSSTVIIDSNLIGKSINDQIFSRSEGIYVYQSYKTFNWAGSIICSNWKLDGVTPTGISYRGAKAGLLGATYDGQDVNPSPGDKTKGFVFNFTTTCSGLPFGGGGLPPVVKYIFRVPSGSTIKFKNNH